MKDEQNDWKNTSVWIDHIDEWIDKYTLDFTNFYFVNQLGKLIKLDTGWRFLHLET